ncbi:Lrp/AsnC family transcriptional regulator [Pseudonocardia nigra]|uniref:Lrp/AsnC family transcriptional regulator n=1 Tax=Pseudonocardia nigra TaxID=1921578 RepID=UPI001C5DE34C|nr:Lrp/AsnC family transcriptional regulator [Pseudonocardia nigra]
MDELDLALINAVQLNPRAPWAEVAASLGVDPATVSRRWARLSATGSAWVTCYPGPNQLPFGCLALVEVDCVAGGVEELADELAGDAHALTVEIQTGARDLLLTVSTDGLDALSKYVMRRIGRLPQVRATRTILVTRPYHEASRWRLDALDPEQRTALGGRRRRVGPAPISADDRRLMLELGADGRTSIADLSTRTGLPGSTVRRRLEHLVGTGRAVLRCDLAPALAGWRTQAMLWLTVPPSQVDATAAELVKLPETRACFPVAGPVELGLSIWLHGLADLRRFEEELTVRCPGLRVVDRAVTTRVVKRVGRLLDEQGRSVGHVPMDLWRSPVPSG